MKFRAGMLLTGAVLIAPLPLTSKAMADDKAGKDQVSAFEYYGMAEFGGLGFFKRPSTTDRTNNRAKFETYGETRPGAFLENLHLGIAATDGSAQVDVWADHVGYDNQNYLLQLSRPGNSYFTLEYDQTPHLYGYGLTLFDTSNPGALTIAPAIRAALQAAAPGARGAIINANVRSVEIKTDRETVSTSVRFTPTPAWDFRGNFSHEHRTGNMPFGTALNGFNVIEAIAPVNYTTQNFGASGQYFTTYGDNKRVNVQVAYNGSIFENDFKSFTFDNPFQLTAPGATTNQGRNSLPPDNYAHRFTVTTGVDLTQDTRYMGTFAYGMMRQNDLFIPKTINPTLAPAPLPAASLNGAIDTLLFNNVVTSRLTNDVTATLRYRYFDNNNRSPILLFTDYVRTDQSIVTTDRQNLPVGYKRQNASVDVRYRPDRMWSVGTSLGWERYDRTRRDVNVTDEISGKIFADASPWNWLSFRTSYLLAHRSIDEYDALKYVGSIAYPPIGGAFLQNPLLRKFDETNRNRHKFDLATNFMVAEGLIITPTFGWRDDAYSDDLVTSGGNLGLKHETAWNAGLELSYALTSATTFFLSYMHENHRRELINRQRGGGCPATVLGSPTCDWGSNIHDIVNTIYAAVNISVTDTTDVKFAYTHMRSNNQTDTTPLGTAGITSTPGYPDVTVRFHRFETTVTNKFDPATIQRLGWKGDVTAKFRYLIERNSMTNWQTDIMTPYMQAVDAGASNSLFLAAINPNYLAQLWAFSLIFAW